ncbi:hypothetical protein ACIA5D_25705 [Actinoplanes sp. NPDC051513]|uniref:hypothetical protein n=1 Tax=Actinoplanes sp. NPDC051513 TaxID=3363908 RepID=UPI00379A75D2
MPAHENPIGRRTVLKALAAAPILASPLAGSTDRAGSGDHRRTRAPRSPIGAPALAHETLIGVL